MKKYLSCIAQTFHQHPTHLRALNKGLTNQNYLFDINEQTYVIRVPYQDSHNIVNRQHEEAVHQLIKPYDLDVPTLYYDPLTGVKITLYLDHLVEYKESNDDDKIERVALLMRRLHRPQQKCGFSFDPIARLRQYQNCVKKPLYNLSYYESIITHIMKMDTLMTCCHNDWVSGNILLSSDGDYLIDYEYAADNDPLFDVMSFITENKIIDTNLRNRFYQAYFGRAINNSEQLNCTYWECFHNLLWCTWAMMMFESRKNPIYQSIADDKYFALVTSYDYLIELE